MEIRDWIRAIGARLALIVVVAGIAAVLAAGLAAFQPQKYRATATIALPDVPVFGPLTSAVAQRVANFQGAVTSDGVLDAVSEETGAPRGSLDAVTSVRSGSGNSMEVRFVGEDPDQARAVVQEATQQALLLQAETDAAFALATADASEVGKTEAQDAYADRAEETGIFAPDVVLKDLGKDYIRATGQGNEDIAADILVQIQEATEVQSLHDTAQQALTAWNEDLAVLREAQGRVDAAQNAQPRIGDVVPLSKLAAIVRQGMYAGLFGAALAVGFVIIVELLRTGVGPTRPSLPRPSRQRASAGAF